MYEIDHIYKYIVIEDNIAKIFATTSLGKELNRLKRIQQLGLIARRFPLARHTKYEHNLGVFYLVDKMLSCANVSSSANIRDSSLKIAALVHGIGHLPFSFATEKALLLAASVDLKTNEEIKEKINFVGNIICGKCKVKNRCFEKIILEKDVFHLFKWFSAYKVFQARQELETTFSSMASFNINEVCKYLVCKQNIGYKILYNLDRFDCIIRDLFYIGTINVSVNLEYYLKNINIGSDKKLTLPQEWKGIASLENYLEDNIYNNSQVNAYCGIFVKIVAQNIVDGKISLSNLFKTDDRLLLLKMKKNNKRVRLEKNRYSLGGFLKSIDENEFKQVYSKSFYQEEDTMDIERRCIGCRTINLFKYPKDLGFFATIAELREEIKSSQFWDEPNTKFIIFFNFKKGNLKKCLEAIAKFEKSGNLPTESDNRQISEFIFGEENFEKIDYERYKDLITPIISNAIKIDNNKLNISLDEGINSRFLYWHRHRNKSRGKEFLANSFIKNPRLFTEDFTNLVKLKLNAFRKKEKRERGKEFIYFIERNKVAGLKGFGKNPFHKWIIPSLKIKNRLGEIDVVGVYLFKNSRPVIDLIECSTDKSSGRELEAMKQLKQKNHILNERFGNRVRIRNFFNDRELPMINE